jgi:inorganic triphosphatase YgiF
MAPTDLINDDPAASNDALNRKVALTVALLASFMGVCKIKDDNINQAMQQAQADKIDHWGFYQARNQRQENAHIALLQLRLAAAARPASEQPGYGKAIEELEKLEADQARKKLDVQKQARDDQTNYDALNYRDDQFDLSDAALALALSMLAVTTLTRQRWLYRAALVPTVFGVFYGTAGLFGLPFHPTWLTSLLS